MARRWRSQSHAPDSQPRHKRRRVEESLLTRFLETSYSSRPPPASNAGSFISSGPIPNDLLDLRDQAIESTSQMAIGYPPYLEPPVYPSGLVDSEGVRANILPRERESNGAGYDVPEPCPREGRCENPYANGGCRIYKVPCHLPYIGPIRTAALKRVVDWKTINGIPVALDFSRRGPANLRGALILHTRGELIPNDRACRACKSHRGPFASCVVGPWTQNGRAENGACTCCIWRNQANKCSLVSDNTDIMREAPTGPRHPEHRTPRRHSVVAPPVAVTVPPAPTPSRDLPYDPSALRRVMSQAREILRKHGELQMEQEKAQAELKNMLSIIETVLGLEE